LRFLLLLSSIALFACGGNGGANNSPPPPDTPATTAIYDVQGSDAASPLAGQTVTVEGVVTGDFQDNDDDQSRNLGGFYIQSAPDTDPTTSDGVFVFDGDNPTVDINIGDLVRVDGTVQEYFGETQIVADSVAIVGTGIFQPTDILLPRFGEVWLGEGGRQFNFTEHNAPDIAAYDAHIEAISARRFILDDGHLASYVSPIRYLNAGMTDDYSIRLGDQIRSVTGLLRYSRGSGSMGTESYRLMPTIEPLFDAVNPRPLAPNVSGELRITSFNLNNFFSTIDNGQDTCGPSANLNCRGANSGAELQRQLSRITVALRMIDADIVGLVEMENNASASLQTLVDSLNAEIGAGTYTFVDTGTIGNDAIKVGLLYKPATVQLLGSFAILDSSVDPRFLDSRSRPVLAQTFEQSSNGAVMTVAVNHLKSKGSSCASSGDPDLGDGQSNCSATRTAAAVAMIDWLATDPTSSGDADFLVIGDPNAHTLDDAISTFRNSGYVDLAQVHLGMESYSFEFDAQSGALDHALASGSLAPQVKGVLEWHINADEPRVLNYDLESDRDPSLFDDSLPYRASDHDPLIIGLDLTP